MNAMMVTILFEEGTPLEEIIRNINLRAVI